MNVRPFVARLFLLLGITVAWALPCAAQGTGAIRGTVTDQSGAVLPGASVTLSSAEGTIGGNQEAVSDDRGTYQFIRLVPGTYRVRAQLSGFQPIEQRDIIVAADATSRSDLRLTVGSLEETIVVTRTPPAIDTQNANKQTVISKDELEALPNRTDIWSVSKVLPSISMNKIDVGGAETFSASVPIVRGSSNETKYMVDGMDVSSPSGTATIANFYLDPFSYEETSLQIGAGSAENSSGGLTFNLVTRSGSNRWRGGFKANGTFPDVANGRNYSPELRSQLLSTVPQRVLDANPSLEPGNDIRKMTDVGAHFSGPILRDRLWFSTTWHDQRMDQHVLGGYNPDGSLAIDDNVMWNTTGKVSWQVTQSAQLSYFNNTQYKLNGHFVQGNVRASFAEDRAKPRVFKYPTVNQVKFTTPIRQRMAFDVTYNRFRSDNAFTPQPEVRIGDVPVENTTTGVERVATSTTCPAASCTGYYTTPLYREQVKTSLSLTQGSHDLKVGYEFIDITRDTRAWNTSEFSATYNGNPDDPTSTSPNDIAARNYPGGFGLPNAIQTYTLPVAGEPFPSDLPVMFSYRAREQGFFVQDQWQVHRRVVLNLGLRYETNVSWEPAACVPASNFFGGACYDEVRAPEFGDVAPRASVVFDVFGDGRTVVKATANRYNLPLSVDPIGVLNPITAPADSRQWLPFTACDTIVGGQPVVGCDRNNDGIPQLSEAGPSPGYTFSGIGASYAEDYRRPIANEYTVDFQRELPGGITGAVTYIHRGQRHLRGFSNATGSTTWSGPFTVTEVDSGETVQVWNRVSNVVNNFYDNSEFLDTNYRGVDLMASKRMSNRWSMIAGGSFGRSRSKTRGGDRANPNTTENPYDADQINGNDRPWSYRLSGNYQFPYDVSLAGTWQYQAGAPETTTVLVTNRTRTLAQGSQSVVVRPTGDVRYPNIAQLDLSLRKSFRLPNGQRFVPRLEVFNLTNEAAITNWVTQLGPTYHRPASIQHGRMWKFEVAYDF